MPFLIFAIVTSAFGLVQGAEESGICADLHTLTCAPVRSSDGTEIIPRDPDHSFWSKSHDNLIKISVQEFTAELRNSDNADFLQLMVSASGLASHPSCDSDKKRSDDPCLRLLAQAGSQLLLRRSGGEAIIPNDSLLEDRVRALESPTFQKLESKILSEFRKSNGQDILNAKIESEIFPEVQQLIINRMSEFVVDQEVRSKLISKIRAIRVEDSNCYGPPSMPGSPDLAGEMVPGAFYHPVENSIQICSAQSQRNNSVFALAHTVAHEISHSIDPCFITIHSEKFGFSYPENITMAQAQDAFPIPQVLSCLRSDLSVSAKRSSHDAQAFKQRRNAVFSDLKNDGSSNFCEDDQITEAFCDWMAAEILPEYIKKNHKDLSNDQIKLGYANIFRDFCSDDDSEFHPATSRRVNNILLAQPHVRNHLNCPREIPGRQYCDPSHTKSDNKTRQKTEAIE